MSGQGFPAAENTRRSRSTERHRMRLLLGVGMVGPPLEPDGPSVTPAAGLTGPSLVGQGLSAMGGFEHYALDGGCEGDCQCEHDLFAGLRRQPIGRAAVAMVS